MLICSTCILVSDVIEENMAIKCVDKFLNCGANPNVVFKEYLNETAMFVACREYHLPLMKLFGQYKYNFKDLINCQVKHTADCSYLGLCGQKNTVQGLQYLMEKSGQHIDIYVTDTLDDTGLHFTSENNCVSSMEYLLTNVYKDTQSIINARNGLGNTPVMVAQSVEGVKILVKHGCDLGITNNQGYLLIHQACAYNQASIVRHIIENNLFHDLNVETKSKTKQTALNVAIEHGSVECVDLLCDKQNRRKLLIQKQDMEMCVKKNRWYMLKVLLKTVLDQESVQDWDSLRIVMNKIEILQTTFITQLINNIANENECTKFLFNLFEYGFKARNYHFISLVLNYNLLTAMSGDNNSIPNVTVRIRRASNTKIFEDSNGEFENKANIRDDTDNVEWKVQNTLGEGAYGKVKLAIDQKTGNKVALKLIKLRKMHGKSSKTWSKFIDAEITPISMIDHPNIINIIGYNLNARNKHQVEIVLEYAPFGDLFNLLQGCDHLDEYSASICFRQIVSGIKACHEKGIVHRDLKLSNILLGNEFQIKIADFGLSKLLHDNEINVNVIERCGTPGYMAPELFVFGQSSHNKVNYTEIESIKIATASDVFAVGIILWKMLNGIKSSPFEQFKTKTKFSSKNDFIHEYPNYSLLTRDTNTCKQFWQFHQLSPFLQFDEENVNYLMLLFENMFVFDPLKRIEMKQVEQNQWLINNEEKIDNENFDYKFLSKISDIYCHSDKYKQTIQHIRKQSTMLVAGDTNVVTDDNDYCETKTDSTLNGIARIKRVHGHPTSTFSDTITQVTLSKIGIQTSNNAGKSAISRYITTMDDFMAKFAHSSTSSTNDDFEDSENLLENGYSFLK